MKYIKVFIFFISLSFYSITANGQQWTQMAAFPAGGTSGLYSFTVNDTAYIGGSGANIYRYDPEKNVWVNFVKIPTGNLRFNGISFSINGKGYIGMGNSGSGPAYNDLWEIDLSTKKWTRKADFPLPGRDGLLYFVADGKAFVGGGTDNTYVYDDFYEFDPVANTWTQRASLPMGPLVFASAFMVKGYGFITGGSQTGSSNFNIATYGYDHINDAWKQYADFPGLSRQSGITFNMNGNAYYGLGGISFDSTYKDIFEYDPATDEWKSFTELPGDARGSSVAVSLLGKVYLGTGSNYSTSTLFYSDWWCLDPAGTSAVPSLQASNQLFVYPNPAHTTFSLLGDPLENSSEITVYGLLGKDHIIRKTGNGKYDCSALPSGEYFLNAQGSGKNYMLKLIKQ